MEHFLANWGYLALFAFNFTSAMGIPVGSEPAMGYAGALASGQLTASGDPHLQLGLVIVVAIAGDTVGSLAGYSIGRFGGRPLVDRLGRYILLTHRDLDRAEAWFKRRGDPFVFIGRLIPLLRSFVSLAAGIGEMAWGTFVLFTLLGVALYDAAICSIGYALGSSWSHVIKDFSDAGYVVAVLVVLGVAAVILHRVSVVRSERGAHAPSARGVRLDGGSTPDRISGSRRGASWSSSPESGSSESGSSESGSSESGSSESGSPLSGSPGGTQAPQRSHVRVQGPVRPRTETSD